jgi:hypothetical protein
MTFLRKECLKLWESKLFRNAGRIVGQAEMMGQNHLTWIMYVMACIGLSAEARRIRNQGAHDSLAS